MQERVLRRVLGVPSGAFGQRLRSLMNPNRGLPRQPVSCGQARFHSRSIAGLRKNLRPRRSIGLSGILCTLYAKSNDKEKRTRANARVLFSFFSVVRERLETGFNTERSTRILNKRSLDNRIRPRDRVLFTFI
jgi:hypothetical protein